ncbi:MAG: hypothetical protein IPM92_10355 [Saprospiraceae bacterium]|nr:hypothetical protein [Saprospiraceae bacterium]
MNIHPIYNEDPELPFGKALKNADGFKVPEHYFENSEEMIILQCSGLVSQESNATSGFDVPVAYFENFTDSLIERINAESLAFLPKSDGFKVPESYFETFYNRLQNKLSAQHQSTPTKLIKFHKLWYWAAAACLFSAVGLFAIKWSQNQTTENLLAQCSEEELLEYVTAYVEEFDEQSLALLLEENDINQLDMMNGLDESAEDLLIEYLE